MKVVLLFASIVLVAGVSDPGPVICYDEYGKGYLQGQPYKPRGCNTCTCSPDGRESCTKMWCSTCSVDGVEYQEGETYPHPDGCNTCVCDPNGVDRCTKRACTASYCYDEYGNQYAAGESYKPRGCNTCKCNPNGGAEACTRMRCNFCNVNGQIYQQGESYPHPDGCNTCVCSPMGTDVCTKRDNCQTSSGFCYDEYGNRYQPGESYKPRGCNTCSCNPGGDEACTLMSCSVCRVNGRTYQPGESYPHPDGCNNCVCNPMGRDVCSEDDCQTSSRFCYDEYGNRYRPGEAYKPRGCNTCSCNPGGDEACTLMSCSACRVNGQTYREGESYPHPDGCNTCVCSPMERDVCTEDDCQTNARFCYDEYGNRYRPGMRYKPTGCTWCVCNPGGTEDCEEGLCLSCMVNGEAYRKGQTYTHPDGCNTCTCEPMERDVCTKKIC